MPDNFGRKLWYTLDKLPTKKNNYTYTEKFSVVNLDELIHMSLDQSTWNIQHANSTLGKAPLSVRRCLFACMCIYDNTIKCNK